MQPHLGARKTLLENILEALPEPATSLYTCFLSHMWKKRIPNATKLTDPHITSAKSLQRPTANSEAQID